MSYVDKRRGLPWRGWSLRWRLTLALFALLAVLLAVLGAYILANQEQTLLRGQANALHTEAIVATLSLPGSGLNVLGVHPPPQNPNGQPSPTPTTGDPATILANQAQAIVRRLASPSLRATIYSPYGDTIAMSDTLSIVLPPTVSIDAAQLQSAFAATTSNLPYQLITAGGQRQLVVLVPLVTMGTHVVAALALNTPTAPLDSSLAALRVTLILGISAALGLAALLVVPVVSVALRPLTAMERTSRAIAAGALALRLREPPTRDEIGRLARAFNAMVTQLEATFQRQKQFIADASHELRTPLTALRGGLEVILLGADAGDPAASRRLLRGMYAETLRMQRLIDDLLTLTQLDNQRLTLRLAPIPLAEFLAQLVEEAAPLTSGQIVRTTVDPPTLTLVADADRLQQILLNLLSNALKFTPATGEVTITAQAQPDGAGTVIIVRDTGSGIPPDALPHIFDRFFRAEASRARTAHHEGSGLGLAIVRGLVEAHGGMVAIASEPEVGTTVTISLPISPATGKKA